LNDTILIGALLILIGNLVYLYYKKRKELLNLREINFELLKNNEEIKKTLAMGLYYRFSKQTIEEGETPTDFERFVANVMKNYYGGETYLRGGSGDYGINIELEREEGTFLCQVKCYGEHENVSFEPIALIHSNIIREDANGGFVVTTSDFTEQAIRYNNSLKIELINGIKLVDYWIEGLEKQLDIINSIKEHKEPELEY